MFQVLKQLIQGAGGVEMTVTRIATWIAAGAMIFGGVVPFIPQYFEIKRSGSAEGFSTFVCLTLIIANILRIFFWFGHRFELPLLLQSVIMTFTMLAMVHMCTAVRNKNEIISSKPRTFTDFISCYMEDLWTCPAHAHPTTTSIPTATSTTSSVDTHHFVDFDRAYFWRWTNFESYLQFLLLFALIVGSVTYLLLDNTLYVETIGFLAVLFEAMLGAPQFYRNYQNSSTKGMSVNMVLCWTMGDVFKTIYFIVRRSPRQFWMCGMLQVSLDISILLQVFFYRARKDAVQ